MKKILIGVICLLMALLVGNPASCMDFGGYQTNVKALALYNMREKSLIASENADTKLPIASLTKIMTALVVLEDEGMPLDKKVTINNIMLAGLTGWAVVGLRAGQTVTVEELLYALMLPSAGDAGQALAIESAGSIEEFVAKMNAKAEALGLNNTHFSNPIGRDEDNYSSANDMAKLVFAALENREFKKIFETNSYYFAPLQKTINKTVDLEQNGLIGAKTGFTYEAGRSLASVARAGGVEYLLVVIGANWQGTGHIADSRGIYDYYGKNYGYREILGEGEEIWKIPVVDSEVTEYVLRAEKFEYFLKNDYDINTLEYELEVMGELNRRVEEGDLIAKLSVKKDGEEIYQRNFYLEEVPEYNSHVGLIAGVVGGVLVVMVGLVLGKKCWKKMAGMPWWVVIATGVMLVAAAAGAFVMVFLPAEPEMEIKSLVIERENATMVEESGGGEAGGDSVTTAGSTAGVGNNVPSAGGNAASAGGNATGVGSAAASSAASQKPATSAPVASNGGGNCTSGWGKLMLINPKFTVSTDWIAARQRQLVNLTALYGIYDGKSSNGTPMMDAEAAQHLNEMLNAYKAAYPGHAMVTRSCFRARGTSCGRLCYATGTSDHHSGYTCDLIDNAYGSDLDTDHLARHLEWQWLKANSYKYGFIDRFPAEWAGGSMSQPVNITEAGSTGLYEAWHYRYVGVEAATEIATGKYNNGKYDSLEHYLKASGRVASLVNATCK